MVNVIFAFVKFVGNVVAVAAVPRVNVVPAAIVIVPDAFPVIWNPPSLKELFALIARLPLTVVAAPERVFTLAPPFVNVRFP